MNNGVGKNKILVTGSHRSGTTWVGKMISGSDSVGYIHEPFNPTIYRPGICGARFNGFTYVSKENEDYYFRHLKNTFEFSYNLTGAIRSVRGWKDIKRVVQEFSTFHEFRKNGKRPIVKDPIAVFSAEWLGSKFNMDVIILIRHPAAFASSIKRMKWTHSFTDFLKQPSLMKEHLYPFEEEIRAFAEKEHGVIEQAILIWRLIHHMISKYQRSHKDWIFLRHEDLSREPIKHFQRIFKKLNLQFTDKIKAVIEEYSSGSNESEAAEGVIHLLKRDSRSNIYNWKNRLTLQEITEIRHRVEAISHEFYSDEDW